MHDLYVLSKSQNEAKELFGLTWLAPGDKGIHTTLPIITNAKMLDALTKPWLGYLQKTS